MNKSLFYFVAFVVVLQLLLSCKKAANTAAPVSSATINGVKWNGAADLSYSVVESGNLFIHLESSSTSFINMSIQAISPGNYILTLDSLSSQYATYSNNGTVYNIANGSISLSSVSTPDPSGFVSTKGTYSFNGVNSNNPGDNVNITGSFTLDKSHFKTTNVHGGWTTIQIWNLINNNGDIATVSVAPFTFSGTFNETGSSSGWWTNVPCGRLRLPVSGSITHTNKGAHWTFSTMYFNGCVGSNFVGSGEGYSEANMPSAITVEQSHFTLIENAPIPVAPYWVQVVDATPTWSGRKIN